MPMTFTIGSRAVWFIRAVTTASIAAVAVVVRERWTTVVCAVLGVVLWQLAASVCRRFCGELTDTLVRLRYGALWQCETVVPLSAIRSIEQWTPPLARFSDTCIVILRFAGGNLRLPLLSEQTAATLVERLQQKEK